MHRVHFSGGRIGIQTQMGIMIKISNVKSCVANVVYFLKNKIKIYRDKRFLRKHGCDSWKQFNYVYDPDINMSAARVVDYYHGYKCIKCIDDANHFVYHWDIAFDGVYVLSQWCDENLVEKYRIDFLRVEKINRTTCESNEKKEWIMNQLFGGDYIFIAFKDPMDYTLFTLRWG